MSFLTSQNFCTCHPHSNFDIVLTTLEPPEPKQGAKFKSSRTHVIITCMVGEHAPPREIHTTTTRFVGYPTETLWFIHGEPETKRVHFWKPPSPLFPYPNHSSSIEGFKVVAAFNKPEHPGVKIVLWFMDKKGLYASEVSAQGLVYLRSHTDSFDSARRSRGKAGITYEDDVPAENAGQSALTQLETSGSRVYDRQVRSLAQVWWAKCLEDEGNERAAKQAIIIGLQYWTNTVGDASRQGQRWAADVYLREAVRRHFQAEWMAQPVPTPSPALPIALEEGGETLGQAGNSNRSQSSFRIPSYSGQGSFIS